MATYSDPVSKTWTLNDAAGFTLGNAKGTEFKNPDFADKIVLECVLGENLLKNAERDWNPSFEDFDPGDPSKPDDWSVISAATGSEYIQSDPKGAFDGEDYVRIRNLDPLSGDCGQLALAPNDQPFTLNLEMNPAKTFTIRYHGRYVNTEQRREAAPYYICRFLYDDINLVQDPPVTLFGEADVLPDHWSRTDCRFPACANTSRKLMMLWLYFGQKDVGPPYTGQHWDLDMVEIAETFPANPTYFARGTYESPVLYTPPGLSKVTWGTFAADTVKEGP